MSLQTKTSFLEQKPHGHRNLPEEEEMIFGSFMEDEDEDDSLYEGSPYGGNFISQEEEIDVKKEAPYLSAQRERSGNSIGIPLTVSSTKDVVPPTPTSMPVRTPREKKKNIPATLPVVKDIRKAVAPQARCTQEYSVEALVPKRYHNDFERECDFPRYRYLGIFSETLPAQYFSRIEEEKEIVSESKIELKPAQEVKEEPFVEIPPIAEIEEKGLEESDIKVKNHTVESFPISIEKDIQRTSESALIEDDIDFPGSDTWEEKDKRGLLKKLQQKQAQLFSKISSIFQWRGYSFHMPKLVYSYALLGGVLIFGLGATSYIMRGVSLQGSVLGVSNSGIDHALSAIDSLKEQDFSASGAQFESASDSFHQASTELVAWAGILSEVPGSIPFFSKIASGNNALKAGEHLSLAGKYLSEIIATADSVRGAEGEDVSLLAVFQKSMTLSEQARDELASATTYLEKVHLSDIPEDKRDQFAQLKKTVPVLLAGLDSIHTNSPAFTDVLGGNGPRKYLFLFQNNQEARATGGFIGSYGVLDMKDGGIRKFFIDGIFNPDGQLKVDIIPPQPIRKVSAGWSLHDSNWFADFPTSAEKAIFFYEKTGGPTVDGVITMTPTVLQRILTVTGPVYLPEYDVTIDSENVIPTLQYKVEVDYDKEENRPKKILGDLAPILLERVMHTQDPNLMMAIIESLHTSLREKDILLYSRNTALQSMYQELGWSGELRETSYDFLSVVNSNINGYKTDGVIEQTIRHNAAIQEDGSIVDTVTITRKHTGGDTSYDWWNAVNADYMRLYVPKGAELISVKGQTRETVKDPLDYKALHFQEDELLNEIESTLSIDPDSGTQIFEESGKTVFGNWVYVSPKESTTVEYTYILPFRAFEKTDQITALYSLLVQKQSGSFPSNFSGSITYPEKWKTQWLSSNEITERSGTLTYEGLLETDIFKGSAFYRE